MRTTSRGGVGTNQYQVKGLPKRVAPPFSVSVINSIFDLSEDQRRSLARSHHATPTELECLVCTTDWTVRMVVAGNPHCPAYLLRELATDRHDAVLTFLAGNPSCPPDLMEGFATHPFTTIRKALATNRKTPLPLLVRLTRDNAIPVSMAAFCNRSIPALQLNKMINGTPLGLRWELAKVADSRILTIIAKTDMPAIRAQVAKNQTCPPTLLARLAKDTDPQVPWAVASNPSALPSTLKWLATNGNTQTAATALRNPNCPAYLRAIHVLGGDTR